ncbi:MAG: MFS transporter, partial [Chloroflexi bacterium]|nr:MFS transporter [Chloroflexota bacterium]
MRIIFLTIFLDVFTYGMVAPLLPFYVQRHGGGAALAGIVASLYALMQLFSGPVLGPLSDRLGRRPVLLGCLLGTAAAYAMLGLGDALAFVFLAVALDGLTGGNLTTAQAYVADLTSESERARGIGMVGAAMGLGLMTGPALGGALSVYGLHWPALAGCAVALTNIAISWIFLKESLPRERRAASLHWPALNLVSQLRQAFAYPALRRFLATLFTLNLAFAGLQTNFPLFSQARFDWTPRQNGWFFAFVGVCAVITQGYLVGRLTPRWGERRLSLAGLALMTAMLAGVALAQDAWLLFPLVGLAALGSSLSIPSLTSLVSRGVEASRQGA